MFVDIAKQYNQKFIPYHPYGDITNRQAFLGLDSEWQKQTLLLGEKYQNFEFPSIPATLYMEFCRNGNRAHFESIAFSKRLALNALVLAECIENKGRFLDTIINGILSICEESSWCLPAHNLYIRDGVHLCLPDVTAPVMDLFSCETAALLSCVSYLLKPVLDEVSPLINQRILLELEKRIFTPYQNSFFWWMGDGINKVNNWTVWCTQNVLLSTFLTNQPASLQKAVVSKACKSLDYFYAEYDEDGCCDEGAHYYKVSSLCLFLCIDLLNTVTDQAFQTCFSTDKVKNMASYLYQVHIDDKYYVNFADCAPIIGRATGREYLFAKSTKNDAMMHFTAQDFQKGIKDSVSDLLLSNEHSLFFRLLHAFTIPEMKNFPVKDTVPAPDFYYSSVGLFGARDTCYYLAVKAGDNDDSHNHNDVGSFTIYKNGQPMIIDIGVETYTRKTFSPERYDIWTMQSAYHNLPTIHGIMQQNGEEFAATDIVHHLGEQSCDITMDIAGAYPTEAKISSYKRRAVLEKGCGITISDSFSASPDEIVLSLMTYEKPVLSPTDASKVSIGNLGTLQLDQAAVLTIEEIPITDAKLKTTWKHEVYRILIQPASQNMQMIFH